MPSARTLRPAPASTSGTAPCAGMCGAARRASLCWTRPAMRRSFTMYSTFPIPAGGRIPAFRISGSSKNATKCPFWICSRASMICRPRCLLQISLNVSHHSLQMNTGRNSSAIYSTSLTDHSWRSTMISTSPCLFAGRRPPASPICCKPVAASPHRIAYRKMIL